MNQLWPGCVLPTADLLVQVESPEEANIAGLPGPRFEEFRYSLGS